MDVKILDKNGNLNDATHPLYVETNLDTVNITGGSLTLRYLDAATDSIAVQGGNTVDVKMTLDGETVQLTGGNSTDVNVSLANESVNVRALTASDVVSVQGGNSSAVKATLNNESVNVRALTSSDVVTVEGGNTTDVKVSLDSEEVAIRALTASDVVTVTGTVGVSGALTLPTGAATDAKLDTVIADHKPGTPIMKVGYYNGSAGTYQTLATWTVGTGKTGYIHDVSLGVKSGGEPFAQFKLTIAGVVQFTDVKSIGGISLPIHGLGKLAATDVVLLEVKSDGAQAVTVNGSIVGREV